MKMSRRSRLLTMVMVLVLVSLACLPGTATPTQPPPPPPNPTTPPLPPTNPTQPPANPTKPPVPAVTATQVTQPPTTEPTMNANKKAALAKATVRFLAYKNQGGKMVPLYTGSGTILTPDGYILTNCHVADPATFGMPEYAPDLLTIELVDRDDRPPVPTYIAKVLAVDPTLDLAVVKVDKTLNGAPVDPATLKLPYVPMGNSDTARLGDALYIFGFPSIGGNTITYTTGSISGFDSQEKVGDRAWFKTDATIAGGNSGGQAANASGELIGVPTRLGTDSATKYTDCRRIQDTNGDGKIDEKDSCIPTGGFINSIRPVNWAQGLITAARSGQAYVSPYGKVATQQPTQPPGPSTTTGKFTLVAWTTAVDANNCATNKVTTYPTGTAKIYAVFSWTGMTQGAAVSWKWDYNGRTVATSSDTWKAAASGQCYSFSLYNRDGNLPDGDFVFTILSGNNVLGTASTKIGGTTGPTTGGTVLISGKIVDANTNAPIPEALVVVLKEGVDIDKWLDDGTDDQVMAFGKSDANGAFTLNNRLQRGVKYGMAVGAKNYRMTTGYITLKADTPDNLSVTFQLSK
ncbi:MAG TPA: trypsin-like peptidase domain-containing protein [Anaerolineaceae bacterium]